MTRRSIFGLQENVASMLCYSFFFFSGIIILIMEKENRTVRFHALQSILCGMVLSLARMVAVWVPFVGGLLISFIGMLTAVIWIYLMLNAYLGRKYKLPMIGDIAEAQTK